MNYVYRLDKHLYPLLVVLILSCCFMPLGSEAQEFDGQLPPTDPNEIQAIQLYSQSELIRLINQNTHLQRVKLDRCQLVEDIEARATVLEIPAYQFLWGDMLAWGVCVERDPKSGILYMQESANQGFPAGLEHLGRYARTGTLINQDYNKAILYLREASALGSEKALVQLVDLFLQGYGSPYDYQDAYIWLSQVITSDKAYQASIVAKRQRLAQRMSGQSIRIADEYLKTQ